MTKSNSLNIYIAMQDIEEYNILKGMYVIGTYEPISGHVFGIWYDMDGKEHKFVIDPLLLINATARQASELIYMVNKIMTS